MDNNTAISSAEIRQPSSPGKAITGMILGIGALVFTVLAFIFAILAFNPVTLIVVAVYGIIFSLWAFGLGLAGWLLSIGALCTNGNDRRAKIGRPFSAIGFIGGLTIFLFILGLLKSDVLIGIVAALIWLLFMIGFIVFSRVENRASVS